MPVAPDENRLFIIFIIIKDKRVNKHLTEKQIDGLLPPTKYAGLAAQFVDRVTGRKYLRPHPG